jgi:hypothetical protein
MLFPRRAARQSPAIDWLSNRAPILLGRSARSRGLLDWWQLTTRSHGYLRPILRGGNFRCQFRRFDLEAIWSQARDHARRQGDGRYPRPGHPDAVLARSVDEDVTPFLEAKFCVRSRHAFTMVLQHNLVLGTSADLNGMFGELDVRVVGIPSENHQPGHSVAPCLTITT